MKQAPFFHTLEPFSCNVLIVNRTAFLIHLAAACRVTMNLNFVFFFMFVFYYHVRRALSHLNM